MAEEAMPSKSRRTELLLGRQGEILEICAGDALWGYGADALLHAILWTFPFAAPAREALERARQGAANQTLWYEEVSQAEVAFSLFLEVKPEGYRLCVQEGLPSITLPMNVSLRVDGQGFVRWASYMEAAALPLPLEWALCQSVIAVVREGMALARAQNSAVRREVSAPEGGLVLLGMIPLEADQCLLSVHDVTVHPDAEILRRLGVMSDAERVAEVGSWRMTTGGGLFEASPNLTRILGRGAQEPVAHPNDLIAHLHQADHETYVKAVWACIARGEGYDLNLEHLRSDGSTFAARLRGRAEYDESGTIIAVIGTVEDISARVATEARLSALADNLPEGVIYRRSIDPATGNSPITYVSKGILALVGVTPAEMLGAPDAILNVVHEEDREAYLAAKAEALEHSTPLRHSCRIRHARTGETRWISLSSRLVKEGGKLYWDGIMLDVSGERQVQKVLTEAKEAAETAERLKSKFVAMMGHEVRSPMSTILGMARQLERTALTAGQKRYLDLLERAGRHLLDVLNDLLDFSKLSAGKFQLNVADFDLDDLLAQVSAATSVRAADKGIELVFVVDPAAPHALHGDSLALGQVFINLVTNAIKFTDRGEVSVWLRYEDERLFVEVRDTGVGIPETVRERLFQPFVQGGEDGEAQKDGTGLGLSICRELVVEMGGQIGFESQIGLGTTFHFAVPLAIAAPEPPHFGVDLSGKRIVVLSRSSSMRQGLERLLQDLGAQVRLFAGHAELRAQAEVEADLVVFDLPSGETLDVECLREMRLVTGGQSQLVLVVTPTHDATMEDFAHERGIAAVLSKPLVPRFFVERIGATLGLIGGAAPKETRHLPDFNGRKLLVVDDNRINWEVIGAALSEVGITYDCAENGEVALTMLRRYRYDAVLMDLHMPVMDGFAAVQALRAEPRFAKLQIIALTAEDRSNDEDEMIALGFNAVLMKPLEESLLHEALAQAWLRTAYSVDLAQIEERFSGNTHRAQRTIEAFARDFAERCTEAQNPLIERGRLGRIVHSVKGTAAYVAAERLEALAIELDAALLAEDEAQITRLHANFAAEFLLVISALQNHLRP